MTIDGYFKGDAMRKELRRLARVRNFMQARHADAQQWRALAIEYDKIGAVSNAQNCRDHAAYLESQAK